MHPRRREEDVPEDERRVAAFIRDYEEICRKHRAMVFMEEDEDGDYTHYSVVMLHLLPEDEYDDHPVLEQALEEMRLTGPAYIREEELEVEDDDEDLEEWQRGTAD